MSAAVGASAWSAAIAAWRVYGPNRPRREGAIHQRDALRDVLAVPERAVLVLEQDDVARRRDARLAPRLVQQHQREEADGLGLGQELRQQASEPDRLAGQIRPGQRGARGRVVSLVEDQVDDVQHGVEATRQLGARRHLVGNARVADLGLRTDDPLRHGGRAGEERARDLLGREPAHLAQGQRHLGVRTQGRMAAREHQPQPIVLDFVRIPRRRVAGLGGEPLGELALRRIEPRPPAQHVDGLEAAGGDEPCARVGGLPVAGPSLGRRGERVVQRLLGEIEVAEQADQRGEHAARVGAVDRFDSLAHPVGRIVAHAPPGRRHGCVRSRTGRISMLPRRAGGMRDAISMAWFRFSASMR